MIGWIVCVVLIIPLVYLIYKYREKVELNRSEVQKLITEVELLKQEKNILHNNIDDLERQSDLAIERYKNAQRQKAEELEQYFEGQKRRRQEIMDADMAQREVELETIIQQKKETTERKVKEAQEWCDNEVARLVNEAKEKIDAAQKEADAAQEKFEAIRQPLLQYEKEQQERLFYTIQLPAEYQEDIEFLLTTVAAKVQHPDIISKLVWTEYVKPNIEDTFKRIEIKPEPGIYKLTSLETGKAYIGKSTDVKKRIADHFKSVVGIKSIADQAVHHAILKEGFWNWTIEIITYADKDRLNELEKYYIEFFKTQEFGYNKNSGGGG